MKKSVISMLAGLLLLIAVPSACKYSFSFDFSFDNKLLNSPDEWTKLGVREGPYLKLARDSVFCLDEQKYVNLRSVVDGPVMIVEIDQSDCGTCVRELLDILNEEKYIAAKEKKTILIAGAYKPRDALLLKQTYELPFKLYSTEKRLHELYIQNGIRMFVVDSVYTIRDKFIPNFDRKENIRLYLDQILCGEFRY